jgi:hypothetical protein
MAGERESSIIGFTALYESDLLSYEDAIETLEVGIQPTDTYNKWGVKIMFDHVSLFKGKPTKGRIHLTHQHVATVKSHAWSRSQIEPNSGNLRVSR